MPASRLTRSENSELNRRRLVLGDAANCLRARSLTLQKLGEDRGTDYRAYAARTDLVGGILGRAKFLEFIKRRPELCAISLGAPGLAPDGTEFTARKPPRAKWRKTRPHSIEREFGIEF